MTSGEVLNLTPQSPSLCRGDNGKTSPTELCARVHVDTREVLRAVLVPGKSWGLGVASRCGLRGQSHLRKEPEATGPRAGVRGLERRRVLGFEGKVGVLGKAEDKAGEGEAVVQRQEAKLAFPSLRPTPEGPPSRGLFPAVRPLCSWVLATEEEEEGREGERGGETPTRSQRGRRKQTGGQKWKGTSGHGSEVKGD